MAERRSRRKGCCKYYVNTNFVVDLANGVREAIEFAKMRRGVLCTSVVTVKEFAEVGLGWVARLVCKEYGIVIVKLRKLREKVLSCAEDYISMFNVTSVNTRLDYIHACIAKSIGAVYFVTSGKGACNRALNVGPCCINHGSGVGEVPRVRVPGVRAMRRVIEESEVGRLLRLASRDPRLNAKATRVFIDYMLGLLSREEAVRRLRRIVGVEGGR